MEFHELLEVNKDATLDFFVSNLLEIVPEGSPTPAGKAEGDEIGYVGSVLADHADAHALLATEKRCSELRAFFEYYVVKQAALNNLPVLEKVSAQALIYNGFFRGQMRRRHNVEWFDELVRSFYFQASELTLSSRKRNLYGKVSQNSRFWGEVYRELQKKFAENLPNPYLLRLN